MTLRNIFAAAGSALTLLGLHAHSAAAQRPLALEDYYRVESASSRAISPDGRWVAVVRWHGGHTAHQGERVLRGSLGARERPARRASEAGAGYGDGSESGRPEGPTRALLALSTFDRRGLTR